MDKDIIRSNMKLANADFLSRAPQDVVDKEKERVGALSIRREKLALNLARVEELRG